MDDNLHNNLPELLSIDNMANGAVYEMVTDALKRMAANIADVNTQPTQKRKIAITIEAAPYNDRSGAELTIKVENKLAGQKPAMGTMFVAKLGGEYLAFGKNAKQNELEYDMSAAAANEARAKLQ